MIRRAFVDLDGTLVDFYGGALPLHNAGDIYSQPENLGVYRAQKILSLTNSAFWKPLDAIPTFWEDLTKTTEAAQIVALAEGLFGCENCAVLTAPSLNPTCVPGKRRWVQNHFPGLAERLIFTHNKEFLAGSGNVLFDDSDEMTEGFEEAGGIGVLIPRLWNKYHRHSVDVVLCIKEQLAMQGLY